MDDLQILVKAIVDESSQSSMDRELSGVIERLESKNEIKLRVGLEDSSVQVVQTQLQAIAKQISSANKSGNTLQVFDTAQLQANGRKYFASTKTLIADVQKEFKSLGKVDVTNVFKNAKGDIQSFSASVTKADGTIERFNFNLAKIKDGAKTLDGFVQISSSLTDKNMGSGLNKTLDYLSKIEDRIKTIRSKTLTDTSKPLTVDMQEYSKFNTELTKVTQRIAEIRSQNSAMTSDQKREIDTLVSGLQRYARELQKTAYAANDLAAKTFANQKKQLQAALETDIKKWNLSGVFTGDFKKSVEEAKRTLNGAFDQSGLDAYKHKLVLIGQEFKRIKLDQSASGKILDADRLNTNIQSAQLRIQNLRQTYSALVNDPKLSAKWQALFDDSQMVSSQNELTNLNAEIRRFEQELINAGKHAQSFWDNFKANAVKMGTWMILGGVISGVMRGVTGLYDAVVELDTAMVELKKVTNETDEAYDKFLTSAADKAVQIGTTYADYVSSTADFARLGYVLEDAQGLAEVANIYAVVGDEVDGVDTATNSIISTMKAFNIEAANAMTIVDKFNEVGNNFAISSGGIGDAMSRSASALASANNTIDESIALIVAANNVIQDPDVVGNMWKTVSMRIRGAKTELEEAGLETEYMAESTASLRKQIKALTNVDGLGGFDIMEDEDTFKSTYDIILGISKVWKDISDIDQAALLELLAGKRQGNALASAINNMDDAVKVLETSVDAEGSALAEHEKWMDSIQAKQQQFQAQYEALANTILDSELVKFTYDAGTGLLGWITELVDTFGALPTLAAAITPFFDKLQLFQKSNNKNWLGSGQGISFAWNIGKENLARDIALLDDYNAKIIGLGDSTSDLQAKQIIWNDTIGKGSQDLKNMIKVSDGAKVSSTAYKNAVTGASASTKGLGVSSKLAAVGVQVLNTALNMMISFGVGLAINAIISGLTSLINKTKEAREAAIEAADSAANLSNEIIDLTSKYLELSEAVKTDTSVKENLLTTQDELIEKLGIEKGRIEELVEEYGNLTDAIKAASVESLREAERDLRGGISAQREELFDVAKEYGVASWSMSHIITSWDKDDTDVNHKALQALVDAGYISSGSYGPLGMELYLPSDGEFDVSTVDGVINSYERLGAMMDIVSDAAGSDNEVYTALYDAYNRCSGAINTYTDSISALNENLAQQYMLQGLIGKELPNTQEEFDTYRQGVIDAAVEGGEFIGTSEEIANSVDSVLRGQSQFASFYAEEMNTAGDSANYYKAQLSSLTDVLSKLKTSYSALEAAQEDMAAGGGLSVDTINALASAEENYLDYLYEENGVVKLNTEMWRANANAKMQSEMFEIEQEIASLEEQNAELREQNIELEANVDLYEERRAAGSDGGMHNQMIIDATNAINDNNDAIDANNARIRENQGLLAVYGSLYGSITGDLTAYTEALNNFENIANTIDSVAASYASLANLQETVANGFTLSLDKILEYAKAYPQILDSATVTANGELALNEAVVNSFIEGKKAELAAQIDTQIAELEADKAVLLAKKEHATAQLELAKAVINGESEMSSEFAAYKINLGNAMVEALIAMQVDEADAYRLATAAMAGNEEEFARVAAECFENVDENAVKAAYSMAQSFFTNSYNSSLSIAEIAEQAHQTALAIAGMANGVVAGSSQSTFNGAGGIYTGGYSFSGVDSSFEGVDYDYQSKTISLDDYIANLELDISDYEDAISQIDGQIATLQALKNTPFEKFQNLVSNASDIVGGKDSDSAGSGGSGDSDAEEAEKIVEEYIAAIDEYYEALKRLEAAQERRKSLEKKLEHTDDFSKKIFIASDLVSAYEAEAEAEKNLMAAKQATIAANVGALRGLGFQVDYDSSTNKLFIKNLEHLNELTASTVGEYDTLQDATNALRQETEELIDVTEQLNSDNIAATETIEDLGYQVLETKNDIVSYIEEIYNEQVEAYREIIDLRKELIESAKDEYDYEADIADKVKEIADLQARIDQLALDDSRSALAERRALEEELAELQADLSQTQSDHSTEAQLEALDKLVEDYEKTAEEDIAILKDTVNATESVWNTFYDMILGKNVTVGDSINTEIANAWLRAAEAVKAYGTSVNDLSGVSTVIGTLPKYHTGGVVSESNLGNNELLAVLEEGEVVFTKSQFDNLIGRIGGGIMGVVDSILGNLTKSVPAVSNVVNSFINNNSSDDNSSLAVSPHIEINLSHSGFMSEEDMKKYGDKFADIAIGKINEAFRRKGIINNRSSRLRPG